MTPSIPVDRHIIDVLMRDLVGHDRAPSAFLVYLWLATRERSRVSASLQTLAVETGLSKSSVQNAVRLLRRRRLIDARRETPTAPPVYEIKRPWTLRPPS